MIIKCPVCEGRGVVQTGFYNPYSYFVGSSITLEICHLCNGRMVIDDDDYRQRKAGRIDERRRSKENYQTD